MSNRNRAVWKIVSGNPKMPYRMGNYPVRGKELRERHGYEIELVENNLTEADAKALKGKLNRGK